MNSASVKPVLAYIVVGGLGAVGYISLASLLEFAIQKEWLAGAIAYVILTPVVYLGHYRFTFPASDSHETSLPRYLALQIVGFNLSWLLPLLLAEYVSAPVAFTAVSAGTAIANFFLMKFWAFVSTKMD